MRKILYAFICLFIVSGALLGCYYFGLLKSKNTVVNNRSEITVSVAKTKLSEVGKTLHLVGRIKANHSLLVTSPVTAKIISIDVKSAEKVVQGQSLIQLENNAQLARLKASKVELANERRRLDMMEKLRSKGAVSLDAYEQLQSKVRRLEANVELNKAELDERNIKAPFSGVIGLHSISLGQLVKPGNSLLQLDDLSEVYVDFALPERYLSQISIGQEVLAKTDAWPNFIFRGILKEIDNHVDENTLSIKLRVNFKNPEFKLLDGMMIQATFNLVAHTYPKIPLKSILYLGDERFVYVYDSVNQSVHKRKVVLDIVEGSNVAISKGLQANELVVCEGINKLVDGIKVKLFKQPDDLDIDDLEVPLKKKTQKTTKDTVL